MKITLHPLFLLAGLAAAVFGGLPVFVICALTALLHECGHIFCATRLGYECRGVKLMPYGASAICEIEGISAADEVALALSGPLVNLLICIICAGLWWFFPLSYAATDIIFYASAAMLFLNLLPAYPFDGGRIARRVLLKFLPEKAAGIILRALNALCAVAAVLFFVFVYRNISLLAIAAFLLCSVFERGEKYSRINFTALPKKRGREIKYVIMDEGATYRDALKFVGGGRYVVMQFYGDGFLDEISEDELYKKLSEHSIYDKIIT